MSLSQEVTSFIADQLGLDEPDWDAVYNTLRRNPRALEHIRWNESNALHVACCKNAPLHIAQLIVQQLPDAVKEKDSNGDLPLHCACGYSQSPQVIDFLVPQNPDAVQEENSEGRRPLHVTCTTNQSLEVVDYFVKKLPDAFKEKTRDGHLPLHLACAANPSLRIIQLLVQLNPNAVHEKSCDGWLPLHYACACKRSMEVISWLVQQNPNTALEKNNEGHIPLFLACANDASLAVIQCLIQHQPNTIREREREGFLPLHMACAMKQSLEVIVWLVQQQPHHIHERANNGMTPLDVAKVSFSEKSPDPQTVEWLEAVSAGRITVAKSSPAPAALPKRSPGLGTKTPNGPAPPPTTDDNMNCAKPAAAVTAVNDENDDEFTKDRCSLLAVLVGKKEMAVVSPSYVESIKTEETIGTGYFGTVYKGTDIALKRSFAIKAINTDVVPTMKEIFLNEFKTLSLVRHPNIESLYAYAVPDNVRNCGYLVCELAEKGSLDNFWKGDLGPERLSLFRRRIQIALDVMTAIQFLHIGNDQISSCFYCDITSANIVLKRDFTAQLIDCGLSKFALDASQSSGMPLKRSCDIILSFGAVLAELLTGTFQNKNSKDEDGIDCEKVEFKNEHDTTRAFKKDLDPALGYDTLALPKYVQDCADLAICCMQSQPDDRLGGEAVMTKLVAILSQCCPRFSDAVHATSLGDSLPGTLDYKSKNKCKVCRTFSLVSPQIVCAVCKFVEERRAQRLFPGETRRPLAGTSAKLDASPPLLRHVDMRLNSPVPRLFIIVPMAIKTAMTDPKVWLRSHHRTRYCLYFVCMHSLKVIARPVPIVATKCWLEKVAPVLAMSLYLLQLGLEPGDGIDVDFDEVRVTLKLSSKWIAEILEAVSEILTETGSSDLMVRLRRNEVLDYEDIHQLNGDAYELVVESVVEERGWRDLLKPVRKDGSPLIFWVSKEVAHDTSNGYNIVQV